MKNFFSMPLHTFAALCLASTAGPSLAKSVDLQKLRVEDALFSCLRINYQGLGTDVFNKDYSYFHSRYLPLSNRSRIDYDQKFAEFLEKRAGNFYKEEISVKAENSRGPHTTIFAKCVEFSESKALRDFFLKNPLPVKPYNNR